MNIGMISHNLHIERYHGVIKRMLKPHMRLDSFMLTLIKVNEKYHRKDICTALNIRGAFQPSAAQKEFRSLHPTEEGQFSVTEFNDKFKVSKLSGDTWNVFKNLPTCNRRLCQVTCPKCPSGHCWHEFVCTCEWYSYRNMCEHIHVVAQTTAEAPFDKQRDFEHDANPGCSTSQASLLPEIGDGPSHGSDPQPTPTQELKRDEVNDHCSKAILCSRAI